MKGLLIPVAVLAALFAGCATKDPYANRGSSTAPAGVQSGAVDLTTPDETIPRPAGSLPTTHPNDPRGGIGGEIIEGRDIGTSRNEP